MKIYGPILRRYFLRRVPENDVDDLVQDVFLRIQSAQADEPVKNIESYLFTTAHNVLANRYRDQATRSALMRRELTESAEVIDLLTPERIVIGLEEYERVITAICDLPPRVRQAFELNRFEGLTYQAIANRMGIRMNSVKELIHRALGRIAKELETGR
ncbi:RNA polymerase sigma factor [uncultured Sphingomonas sp.]|uniref:RNA polymerase sigma factor n=1 Tax=uncultured Sphingomonas sp. TaxID=158754 RepID=UPI002627B958|nr:RNA polymerase sigma factor [uncultured Sphingomonas sp.]